ncbi:MAG: pflA [Rariglobus sp.]|jgi:pyruvate formate lyase activating enzyme|nr:pflA [Rariglobus sp.]
MKTGLESPPPPPDTPEPVATCFRVPQGRVHSIESAGMLDGPGIRHVIFLSGCPLRCLYCHNPDTVCAENGGLRHADQLMVDVARRRAFLKGGGLTISGGEPLAQPGFVKTLLTGAKALGLHTAVDTSGHLGARVDDEMLALTDLWLLDIKSFDPVTYKRVTGVDRGPTLAFARRLAIRKRPMWIRFVLVPGLTDAVENIEGVAAFVVGLGPAVERVDVLPFHKMGEAKWEATGRFYSLGATQPTTPAATEAARAIFRAKGLKTF